MNEVAILIWLPPQYAHRDVRWHQYHAGETSRDARNARWIAVSFRMNNARNGKHQRRGAMQNQRGQPGGACDRDIGVDRIPDLRAFGVSVRESSRDVHRRFGARPLDALAHAWQVRMRGERLFFFVLLYT